MKYHIEQSEKGYFLHRGELKVRINRTAFLAFSSLGVPTKIPAKSKKRRTKEKISEVMRAKKSKLLDCQGNVCIYCGHTLKVAIGMSHETNPLFPTFEHVLPKSKGGEAAHVMIACKACNRERNTTIVLDFIRRFSKSKRKQTLHMMKKRLPTKIYSKIEKGII